MDIEEIAANADAADVSAVANVAASTCVEDTSRKRPASSALRPSPTSFMEPEILDLTQSDEEDVNDVADDYDEEEEEETDLPLLFRVTNKDCRYLKIVGIRHYRGVAYEGEYVRLAREPSNPYDRNAIRVDNLRNEKVGHLAKEAAAVLSPIWDQFGDQVIKFDASIPWRGNYYYHPLQLEIRAPQSLWETLKPLLTPLLPYNFKNDEKESAARRKPAVSVTSKKVDWKQQQAQLDQLWKNLLEKQLYGLPEIHVPDALTSPLFAHQRQALNWLVHRENSTKNPFYEETTENGKNVYLCQLTRSSQPQSPANVRGGILADGTYVRGVRGF